MNYIIDYAMKKTSSPYSYVNVCNMYNLLYCVIKSADDEQKKKDFIEMIKLNMGMTFYNDFMAYLLKKDLHL